MHTALLVDMGYRDKVREPVDIRGGYKLRGTKPRRWDRGRDGRRVRREPVMGKLQRHGIGAVAGGFRSREK
jgi:hypothetical protein